MYLPEYSCNRDGGGGEGGGATYVDDVINSSQGGGRRTGRGEGGVTKCVDHGWQFHVFRLLICFVFGADTEKRRRER